MKGKYRGNMKTMGNGKSWCPVENRSVKICEKNCGLYEQELILEIQNTLRKWRKLRRMKDLTLNYSFPKKLVCC